MIQMKMTDHWMRAVRLQEWGNSQRGGKLAEQETEMGNASSTIEEQHSDPALQVSTLVETDHARQI